MSRYKYYDDGKNGVICVSSYAGKKVRGVAKCDPTDTFDYEKGAALAKARVDVKIGEKKFKRSYECLMEAGEMLAMARDYFNDMVDYHSDASKELTRYNETLSELLKTL